MRITAISCTFLLACAVDEVDTPDESTTDQAVANGALVTRPAWSVLGPNGCTASVVNERWLLTAAHCIDADSTMTVYYAPSPGGIAMLYSGHVEQYYHPLHPDPDASDAVHDVGLVHLVDYGLDLATMGRAKIYADARRPWFDAGQPNDMSILGWGYASTPGGSNCDDTSQRLRLGSGLHVDYNPANTHYASAAIGAVHMCDGDSGGQYLLYRGTGSDADYLQFAVHSGRRLTYLPYSPTPTIRHQGALIEDNTAWIETTIADATSRVYDTRWVDRAHGGFAYRQSELVEHGYNDLLGFQYRCMHDVGGTPDRVQLRTCDGSTNQRWNFETTGEITRYSGYSRERYCLEMENNSTANRTPMRVALCNGAPAQRFVFTSGGQIQPAINRNKCVEAGGSTEGAPVQLFDCNGTAPQMWLP